MTTGRPAPNHRGPAAHAVGGKRAPGTPHECRPRLRGLIPPLTIITALVTAVAILATAVAMTPPPLTAAVDAPPSPSPDGIRAPADAATAVSAELAAGTTTLVQTARAALPPSPTVVSLARLTYAPRASGSNQALPGPFLLVVEAGSLAAHLDGTGQFAHAEHATATVEGDVVLEAGDSLVLPTATTAVFRNDSTVPVVALAAGVFPTAAMRSAPVVVGPPFGHTEPARWVYDGAPGATVRPLVGGWLVDLTAGSAAIALRRVILLPGDHVPLSAPGPVALAVEMGVLTTVAGQGLIWVQHPDDGDDWIAPASAATLLSGDGVLLQTGATATLHNDGSAPLVLLELTVVTDGDETMLSSPSRSLVPGETNTGSCLSRSPPRDAGDAARVDVVPLGCGRSAPQVGPYTPR